MLDYMPLVLYASCKVCVARCHVVILAATLHSTNETANG
jgi:hypothetical protein